jgi:hypothetical protein
MADKNDTKTAAAGKAEAAPATQILKQGDAPAPIEAPAPIAGAGAYKVLHGSISFGGGQTAYTGATVSLSAAEASAMLPLGVIEPA